MELQRVEQIVKSEQGTCTTKALMEYLGCGRVTACRIGELAGARVQIGKRVLWNVKKVNTYVDTVSD